MLAEGMAQPMELELAPDGRIFFIEIAGHLKLWKPETRRVVEAGKIDVTTEQESGLLGFALDPKFAATGWIYLFYSPKSESGHRLSRFVMQGDALDAASEKVVLSFGTQRRECCHHAGSVEFGHDGCLFISTGDNTHPHGDSEGSAPIDERPGREPWDAQKSAANPGDLRGKILRILPQPDGSYIIPPGNLFPPGTPGTRPEIYCMGCSNPWRMSVDQATGIVYWGEVGPDAGGDGPRGPRGYDEINQARAAGNFGWPYFIGNNFAYHDYDYATRMAGPAFNPAQPRHVGPNNTGASDLPPAQPAFIYHPYGASTEFPEVGQGGRTACAGPVFHYRPEFARTSGFPEHFDNCLLWWDWERRMMKSADCFNCHALEHRLVGAALVEIAARYRGVEGALETSVDRVQKGSSGVWGPVPMLAHGHHTRNQIKDMVTWVLAAKAGDDQPDLQRGLQGVASLPAESAGLRAIKVEALFTDAGATPASPLTGRATAILRPRRIEAELHDGQNGTQALGRGGANGGKFIGDIHHGQHLRFAALDLTQSSALTCRVASGGHGGWIELHAGTADGPMLTRMEAPNTGGWESWHEITVPLSPVAPARTEVYAVFVNPGKSGLMNLDWIQFDQ